MPDTVENAEPKSSPLRRIRPASHAGSWYDDDPDVLSAELVRNLNKVPNEIGGIGLPVPSARVIIAP